MAYPHAISIQDDLIFYNDLFQIIGEIFLFEFEKFAIARFRATSIVGSRVSSMVMCMLPHLRLAQKGFL